MRELKFRAWLEAIKEMVNIDVLAISECSWSCPDLGKQGVSLAYQPHIPVMQYTGLKDKNGKEIWEGDIISSGTTKTGTLIAWPVVFHFDGWSLGGSLNNPSRPNKGFWKRNEVIGNIYENPELLEERIR